jgi:hypothetical protein
MMRRTAVTVALVLGLALVGATPAGAVICANDPSRTIFAGGPHKEACLQFTDQATCLQAFHKSGAGPLAPCIWNGQCQGNTRGAQSGTPQSCETLPPQNCAGDPSRTIKLAGGTNGSDSGSEVCRSLDQASCEMAWHTTPKGAGMACCWSPGQSKCFGSANGFSFQGCTHDNTCFVEGLSTRAPAPVLSQWTLFALAVGLFSVGTVKLRSIRRSR